MAHSHESRQEIRAVGPTGASANNLAPNRTIPLSAAQAQHDDHDDHDHDDHDEHGGHGHSHTQFSVDIYNTKQALRAVQFGTLGLAITAILQLGITWFVGSAGLLADALHNLGDVFTTVALWVAFSMSRRAATRRYTYGYNRVEDVAGVIIIAVILITAVLGAWESYDKWVKNEVPTNLIWGMIGALIGVVGNEVVASYKISVGKKINSVPLVADGQHSRLDGLTSLAAFVGLIGVWLGFPAADPLAGLIITVVIAFVVFDAVKNVTSRLLDAIDPKLVDELEATARSVPGVIDLNNFRARWFGRNIQVVTNVEVDSRLSLVEGHDIAEKVRHALLHKNGVSLVDVHVDPYDPEDTGKYHAESSHHFDDTEEDHDHDDHDHDDHDHNHDDHDDHDHTSEHDHDHASEHDHDHDHEHSR
jgi:cation diffusion facilitator family transporter